jgi:predicted DNA-binding protein with PD1-like motif
LKIVPVDRTQHLLLRLHAGDMLPDALITALRERRVTAGWIHLSGVLADVELRAYSSEIEGPGGTKRFAGPVQAVTLDGSVGVADGDIALDLRAVLARETDRGLETIGGELLRARVLGLEGSATVLEDTVIPRVKDKSAGVRLFRDDVVMASATVEIEPDRPKTPAPVRPSARAVATPPPLPPSFPPPPAVPPPPLSFPDAVAASAPAAQHTGAPGTFGRPPRRVVESEDGPYPVGGDTVDHFAFGRCEVLKSDGDRLHVRMKDGRIREIAIEMLKVTPLGPDPDGGPTQRYRLDRKL